MLRPTVIPPVNSGAPSQLDRAASWPFARRTFCLERSRPRAVFPFADASSGTARRPGRVRHEHARAHLGRYDDRHRCGGDVPGPGTAGRRSDHSRPDVPAAEGPGRRPRADAWSRGPHRRSPVRPAPYRRPGVRHAADAGAGRAQARGTRHRRAGRKTHAASAARARQGRAVRDRIHSGHAQHAGLRGARHSYAGRRRDSHGRFQDRSDAD